MEILVVLFIMFVVSKLFGGIAKQLPQDQRGRGGRPFPDIPSEWNFPRPGDIATVDIEPEPSQEPSRTKSLMDSSQEKQQRKSKELHPGLKTAPTKITGELTLNKPAVSQFGENPLENLLAPENLMSGIILAELLQPPKSRRGAR